jgi:deoxyadenosine/deoxycytidine kinase
MMSVKIQQKLKLKLKLKPNMKIAIEGNIGCGKSTVISRLCTETRLPIFLEPVDDWKDWLTLFYNDPARYGLAFNLNVLMTFNRWKGNEFQAIYERSPLSNRFVFAELQKDHGKMNALELDLFHKLYLKLGWAPDVIIYIKTNPEVCHTRMLQRARECESQVSLSYLQDVDKKYEDMILNTPPDVTTITVDGNRSHEAVYTEIHKIIKRLTREGLY